MIMLFLEEITSSSWELIILLINNILMMSRTKWWGALRLNQLTLKCINEIIKHHSPWWMVNFRISIILKDISPRGLMLGETQEPRLGLEPLLCNLTKPLLRIWNNKIQNINFNIKYKSHNNNTSLDMNKKDYKSFKKCYETLTLCYCWGGQCQCQFLSASNIT